ncbi:MAG: hypothetical protein AAF242_11320 [Bacteroidota bacterium]
MLQIYMVMGGIPHYLKALKAGRSARYKTSTGFVLAKKVCYAMNIWCGYAYENICLKHLSAIKKGLEIGGIYATASSFFKKGTTAHNGTQIDLVIDRNDRIINLCEIKFYNVAFTITKDYAEKLREKIRVFQETTQTTKQVQLVMITTFGLSSNKHSLGLINADLDMQIFF